MQHSCLQQEALRLSGEEETKTVLSPEGLPSILLGLETPLSSAFPTPPAQCLSGSSVPPHGSAPVSYSQGRVGLGAGSWAFGLSDSGF